MERPAGRCDHARTQQSFVLPLARYLSPSIPDGWALGQAQGSPSGSRQGNRDQQHRGRGHPSLGLAGPPAHCQDPQVPCRGETRD